MDRIRPGEAVRDTAVPDGAIPGVAGRTESIEGVRYAAGFDYTIAHVRIELEVAADDGNAMPLDAAASA